MSRALEVVVLEDEDEAGTVDGGAVIVDEAGDGEALPDGLVADGEGYRLALRRAVTISFKGSGGVREERFEHLPIRRLTGGDMRAMMMSDRKDGSLMLLEAAVTLPGSRVKIVIDRLDAADMLRAMGVIGFLSGNSQPTGR